MLDTADKAVSHSILHTLTSHISCSDCSPRQMSVTLTVSPERERTKEWRKKAELDRNRQTEGLRSCLFLPSLLLQQSQDSSLQRYEDSAGVALKRDINSILEQRSDMSESASWWALPPLLLKELIICSSQGLVKQTIPG